MTATTDAALTLRAAAEQADVDAEQAAAAAGVRITLLDGPDATREAGEVLYRIWPDDNGMPMPPELLRTFSHTDNYVGGVFLDDRLVGVAAAFRVGGHPAALHSHIAGVLPAAQGRSAGQALKLHQRAWALHRDIRHISWTYDPLIRRNAHFNTNKLGTSVLEYLPNFYGVMTDAVNAGEESDRLLVDWDLLAPRTLAALRAPGRAAWHPEPASSTTAVGLGADGGPVVLEADATASTLLVALPEDVEALRVTRPDLAGRWRLAVREALGSALAAGYRIGGVARSGHYVLERNS